MSKRILLAIGLIIMVIGVALIIVSPSLIFTETSLWTFESRSNTKYKDQAYSFGIVALFVGGVISAIGVITPARPTKPPTPTIRTFVTQSISPKSVELGNTPDEVQSVMGQPDKIINLGARVTHIYKDMRIIYVDGKVSDVQLS